jgi:hypothetical protein
MLCHLLTTSTEGIPLPIRTFAVLLPLLIAACNGPLPFLSGGALKGEAQPAPEVWNLEEDFAVCQLETRPKDPYSVNIAYTLVEGRLYINAGDTETEWVKHMQADPQVRLRIDDALYSLKARRVTEPAEITAFVKAWTCHSVVLRDPDGLDEVWIYELTQR